MQGAPHDLQNGVACGHSGAPHCPQNLGMSSALTSAGQAESLPLGVPEWGDKLWYSVPELLDALEGARDEATRDLLEASDEDTEVAELATLSPLALRSSRSARLAARCLSRSSRPRLDRRSRLAP